MNEPAPKSNKTLIFSILGAIGCLGVLVLAVVGEGGYYWYSHQAQTATLAPDSTAPVAPVTAAPPTLKSDDLTPENLVAAQTEALLELCAAGRAEDAASYFAPGGKVADYGTPEGKKNTDDAVRQLQAIVQKGGNHQVQTPVGSGDRYACTVLFEHGGPPGMGGDVFRGITLQYQMIDTEYRVVDVANAK